MRRVPHPKCRGWGDAPRPDYSCPLKGQGEFTSRGPATGDRGPATGDRRPATGDRRPAQFRQANQIAGGEWGFFRRGRVDAGNRGVMNSGHTELFHQKIQSLKFIRKKYAKNLKDQRHFQQKPTAFSYFRMSKKCTYPALFALCHFRKFHISAILRNQSANSEK